QVPGRNAVVPVPRQFQDSQLREGVLRQQPLQVAQSIRWYAPQPTARVQLSERARQGRLANRQRLPESPEVHLQRGDRGKVRTGPCPTEELLLISPSDREVQVVQSFVPGGSSHAQGGLPPA